MEEIDEESLRRLEEDGFESFLDLEDDDEDLEDETTEEGEDPNAWIDDDSADTEALLSEIDDLLDQDDEDEGSLDEDDDDEDEGALDSYETEEEAEGEADREVADGLERMDRAARASGGRAGGKGYNPNRENNGRFGSGPSTKKATAEERKLATVKRRQERTREAVAKIRDRAKVLRERAKTGTPAQQRSAKGQLAKLKEKKAALDASARAQRAERQELALAVKAQRAESKAQRATQRAEKSKVAAKPKADPKTEPKTEAKKEPKPEPKTEAKSESKSKSKSERQPEPKPRATGPDEDPFAVAAPPLRARQAPAPPPVGARSTLPVTGRAPSAPPATAQAPSARTRSLDDDDAKAKSRAVGREVVDDIAADKNAAIPREKLENHFLDLGFRRVESTDPRLATETMVAQLSYLGIPEGVRGVRKWNGELLIEYKVWDQAMESSKRIQAGRRDDDDLMIGKSTLMHEVIHGFGPGSPDAFRGKGMIVEEITTEMVSRKVMRNMYGLREPTRNTGVYDYQIYSAVDAVRRVTGRGERDSYAAVSDAAERYKRRQTTVKTEDESFNAFVSDLASVLRTEAPRLRAEIERGFKETELVREQEEF